MGKEQEKKLSQAEKSAVDSKKSNQPFDKKDYNSARQKETFNEKISGERNTQKRESGSGTTSSSGKK
jgi:hypothetical protein